MSRCTARITNLDPQTTSSHLTTLFQSKLGLPISPGQAQISLTAGLEGMAIATVTFKDAVTLNRALKLPLQERVLHGRHMDLDASFDGFTVLSDGDEIDVVALHGLNGHAFDTWKYRSSSDSNDCFMWLRDSLPKHFPGARVLTYGYNANVLSDVSTGRLRTFAETFLEILRLEREDEVHRHKPLIFIAHSLGGLVIKQALILGRHRADMRYQHILSSTRAIMFFGTPHQGGNGVSTAEFLANLLHAVNIDARSDLIKELNPDSLFLFDLTGDFRQVIETLGIVIYTFFEGKKTEIGRFWPMMKKILIVKEQSAILGSARERKASVNASHADLCKFRGAGDTGYANVRQVLRELITEIIPTVTLRNASEQPSPPSDLKYCNLVNQEELEGDERKYPVLVWGVYTYWALSHIDNRYGMTILAYDGQGRVVRQWERKGARYIVSIKLTRDKVEFIGQAGFGITFSLGDLRIS